ncbi:MFS transporter [Streptomyces sp. TRM68416]|uniref:MFS transporter n=1 Tax=Streptomyces sp. TRM68416 TaxID=2758412 RepID=UPI001661D463|nr:MFS transporter [Streptomyces sp. TRM68416]MBD0843977.1 MFS transporter [Streptomyces sp. TRM68416]
MWILAGLTAAAVFVLRRLRRGRSRLPVGGGAPALLLAAFGVALAQTIVLAALTVFARELDVAATGATWLLTAFMRASAVATPVAGRLGDLFGHRRVIVTGLVLPAGSVVAALSTQLGSYSGTVTGRVLQGLSGGVFPCAFGLARQSVPAERLGGVVAALSAMFGVGGALGTVVAGPLVDVAGPAALFWLVATPALLALAGMDRVPTPSASAAPARRVALAGAALLTGALVALLLAISQGPAWGWSSPGISALFVTAVAQTAAFGFVERRVAAPLIDLRLLIGRACSPRTSPPSSWAWGCSPQSHSCRCSSRRPPHSATVSATPLPKPGS